jgi:hypothetical protein
MRAARLLPALAWLRTYDRAALASDLLAAVIVTIMLIPQRLAYAVLAGLPPYVGLRSRACQSAQTCPSARFGQVTAASIHIDLHRRILCATNGQPDRGSFGERSGRKERRTGRYLDAPDNENPA